MDGHFPSGSRIGATGNLRVSSTGMADKLTQKLNLGRSKALFDKIYEFPGARESSGQGRPDRLARGRV